MESIYRLDGSRVHTSTFAGGPWDHAMQHGSAPAALFAHTAEHMPTLAPMRVARMTIDLMRPVPVATLELKTEILREGRKIQLSNIRLFADGTEVARASILKLRKKDLPLPREAAERAIDVALPETLSDAPSARDEPVPFLSGITMRNARGSFRTVGPAAIWFRATRPIVDGEAISPLMRAAITSDFCNGVSAPISWDEWTFINADLTITLAREPVGDWVLLNAETWASGEGGGIAFASLADTQGYFGRAVQNILIEKR
ncbi:MAG TPA: thioesterase family protein [Rhizomicrobium sp.]|nr:thioesterase family protein [Rhizomicrobium sp.]